MSGNRTYSSKAIETYYKGYRFRSRLEARWAVFFDAIDIPWEYEQQGFNLKNGPYLPDFWLPHSKMFAEVKPDQFTKDEFSKCRQLPFPCLLLDGTPSPKHAVPFCTPNEGLCIGHFGVGGCDCGHLADGDKDEDVDLFERRHKECLVCEMEEFITYTHGDTQYCQTIISQIPGRSPWFDYGEGAESYSDDKEFVFAMNKARAARFEHGESPR